MKLNKFIVMNNLKKTKIGGGKSLRLILLLFLLLGNVGVWAQSLTSLSFGTPLVDEDFNSLGTYSSSTKGTFLDYTQNGAFNYMYCNKGNAKYGIESEVYGSNALFLTPDGTSPLIAAITDKTFGDCGAFSFKVTNTSKCHVGLYAKVNNTAYAKADASVYLHCVSGALSIGSGSAWVTISTETSEIIDVCVIYNNTTEAKTYGDEIALGAKKAHVFVNGECVKDGDAPKEFTIPGATLAAFRIVSAESTTANIDDVKIYNTLPEKAGPKETRTITIETPVNGTLKVFNGATEVNDGDAIEEGTKLTIEAKADFGYKLINWQAVEGGSTQTFTDVFTYTVGSADVAFKATFEKTVYHTITWSVNGKETTTQVADGEAITFENNPVGIPDGYVFTGWYGDEYFATDAPVYVTSATADADKTYYAVFAKSEGSKPSLVKMTMADDFAAGDKVVIVAKVDETLSYGLYQETQSNSYVKNFVFTNNVEDIAGDDKKWLTVSDGTSADDGKWKLGDETNGYLNNSSSNNLNVDVAGTSEWTLEKDEANELFKIKGVSSDKYISCRSDLSGGNQYLYRMAGGTPVGIYSFDIYKYVAGSIVYSDFRTSLTAPTTATITLSEACKDADSFYYGTYSNSKPFVVSEDIIVAEISVIDGKLLIDEYNPGDIVPANTGVMVSSDVAGDHTVNLSKEAGTSILGENNMLRPTGDTGITADEMAAADANCKYYRLTMHKGTTLGFFWGAADGAAFNVAANKAYLAVPQEIAQKIQSFVIGDGGTTSIDGITTDGSENAQRTVYNLQGQRVSPDAAHGLYIVNGKKVIIR